MGKISRAASGGLLLNGGWVPRPPAPWPVRPASSSQPAGGTAYWGGRLPAAWLRAAGRFLPEPDVSPCELICLAFLLAVEWADPYGGVFVDHMVG